MTTLAAQKKNSELMIKVAMGFLVFLLAVAAFITIFPFIWSTILSTKSKEEILSTSINLYFGSHLLHNYDELMKVIPFWTTMFNSLYVSILGTITSVLFCSMGGYAFAVYEFKGKKVLFSLLIASMAVPPILGLIPYFLIVKFLGLMNTHIAIWLPFTATPFGIFLARQYVVAGVPKELLEAAKLDGAGEWTIYWRVVLPLMKPVLGTIAIVQFVYFWNNFIAPLVILNSQDKYVVTLALRAASGNYDTPIGAVMLGTTISILPLVIAYIFGSKQMIAGLTSGAVKG